jgi:tight adherence protein B
MTGLAILLGLGLASGLLLTWSGLRGEESMRPWASALRSHRFGTRAPRAVIGAVILLALTRWPIAAVAGAALGWFSPNLLEGRSSRQAGTVRTEAIAAWAEMMRDTIAAAHGLEAAISATAPLAPVAICEPVAGLAHDIHHLPLHVALDRFAAELDDPIADLVVAALQAGARGGVRELTDLLGALAEAARDEAAMRLGVDAGRARMRTAVRVIAACTAGMAVGLVVLNPSYVEVYATESGQLVLALIALCWGFALWWLAGMSRFVRPTRFLLPENAETST